MEAARKKSGKPKTKSETKSRQDHHSSIFLAIPYLVLIKINTIHLFTRPRLSYCMLLLLHVATACYYVLHFTTACYYCMLLLYVTTNTASYYCILILHLTTAFYYCILLLHVTTACYYCMLLHHTYYYCMLLLHVTTACYSPQWAIDNFNILLSIVAKWTSCPNSYSSERHLRYIVVMEGNKCKC